MNKRVHIIIIILAAMSCLFFLFSLWLFLSSKSPLPPKIKSSALRLPLIETQGSFYDPENFLHAIKKATQVKPRSDIYAIIVPHHLVGADIIAEMIKMTSGRSVHTVVVIGPNHNNIGRETLATAPVDWQTPYGDLHSAVSLTKLFLADNKLLPNKSALEKEHSVGAIMPFIKYYFPSAQVLPIVLTSYAGKVEAEKLRDWLQDRLGKDSLVIFSLDFSHYLTKGEASLKDERTKSLITGFQIDKIYELNNDYVDSPAGLATVLIYAQKSELKISILRHSNSFDYTDTKPVATTSYFGIIFTSI